MKKKFTPIFLPLLFSLSFSFQGCGKETPEKNTDKERGKGGGLQGFCSCAAPLIPKQIPFSNTTLEVQEIWDSYGPWHLIANHTDQRLYFKYEFYSDETDKPMTTCNDTIKEIRPGCALLGVTTYHEIAPHEIKRFSVKEWVVSDANKGKKIRLEFYEPEAEPEIQGLGYVSPPLPAPLETKLVSDSHWISSLPFNALSTRTTDDTLAIQTWIQQDQFSYPSNTEFDVLFFIHSIQFGGNNQKSIEIHFLQNSGNDYLEIVSIQNTDPTTIEGAPFSINLGNQIWNIRSNPWAFNKTSALKLTLKASHLPSDSNFARIRFQIPSNSLSIGTNPIDYAFWIVPSI